MTPVRFAAGALLAVASLAAASQPAPQAKAAQGLATRPASRPATQPAAKTATQPGFTPTSGYEVRQIEGWRRIYVHKDLLTTHKDLGAEVLTALAARLYDVSRVVPPGPLAELRKVPIWVEYANPRCTSACYHPSLGWLIAHGRNPEKAQCIELGNARNFLHYLRSQPWMVLHELAHAYQDRVLPDGYGNKEIKAAYESAKAGKTYDSVLLFNGRMVRHYAMSNPMEYFAELSEAYFGVNDFYPFVQAELKVHDPEGYKLLRKLWRVDKRK